MDCYYCKAKEYCIAAAQPGSMVCLVNRMRYGGTHADDAPPRQDGGFCQYCVSRCERSGGNGSATM